MLYRIVSLPGGGRVFSLPIELPSMLSSASYDLCFGLAVCKSLLGA